MNHTEVKIHLLFYRTISLLNLRLIATRSRAHILRFSLSLSFATIVLFFNRVPRVQLIFIVSCLAVQRQHRAQIKSTCFQRYNMPRTLPKYIVSDMEIYAPSVFFTSNSIQSLRWQRRRWQKNNQSTLAVDISKSNIRIATAWFFFICTHSTTIDVSNICTKKKQNVSLGEKIQETDCLYDASQDAKVTNVRARFYHKILSAWYTNSQFNI